MNERSKIAMFGHKRWSREGGVEIVVKELCTRMAQKGCEVTCYNRSGHHVSGAEYDSVDETEYKGITQKYVPTIEKKVSIVINSKFILCVPPFSLLVWINNGGSQSQPPGSSACTHAGISGIIRCK